MYRVSILKNNGTHESKNFDTKNQCEDWILKKVETGNIKKSIIVNKYNIQERYSENW